MNLEQYYLNQAGSGLPVYFGRRNQSGRGIGNILGKLARFAMPLLKAGTKYLGKKVLEAGTDVMGDVVKGVPVKQALKRQAVSTGINIKNDLIKKIAKYVPIPESPPPSPPRFAPKLRRKKKYSRARKSKKTSMDYDKYPLLATF